MFIIKTPKNTVLKEITRSITTFSFLFLFPLSNQKLSFKAENYQEGMVAAEFSRERLSSLKWFLSLLWPYVYFTHWSWKLKHGCSSLNSPKTQCYNEWNPVCLGYNRKQLFFFKWIKPNNLMLYYCNLLIVGEADILFNLWYFSGCIPTTKQLA